MRALLLLPLASSLMAGEWASSRLSGSPEPARPYLAEQVYASSPLKNAQDMLPLPGSGRMLIAELGGKIWSVSETDLTAPAELWLDLKTVHPELTKLYSLQFHPRYAENGQMFITWIAEDKHDAGSKLYRYKTKGQGAASRLIPGSGELLLTWLSGGHNGAAMQFGADGMLYLSTGDAEVPAPPDPRNTGQNLDDLLSCILRLDVDKPGTEGRAYAIPADNPFLNEPGARPEIWAYGFRNPWKISFDRKTDRLWVGDVGWELWESIHVVKRGGNYGWSAMEATQPVKPHLKGKVPISPPIVAHPHTEAASITGGYVYRGSRLPELRDAYVYADYETGKIWALWYDGEKIVRHEEIADTPLKIVSFGEGADGELYFLHYAGEGSVHRLVANPKAGKPSEFPRKLSETGLFQPSGEPQPGVLPYDVHAPMWHDGATAQRWVALPKETAAPFTKLQRGDKGVITGGKTKWNGGSVLAKTLSAGKQRIETQVLLHDGDSWQGYSYRWNDAGTDAELVGANGDEKELSIDGRKHSWRFHSRAECMRCHTMWTGFMMGFQPQQLKDPERYVATGVIPAEYIQQCGKHCVDPADEKQALEPRARSWLHANCAHCHRQSGGGSVPLWLNIEEDTVKLHAINESPTRGDMGLGALAKVISAGAPAHSAALHRIGRIGAGHMPIVGSTSIDAQGLHLLHEWIASLAPAPAEEADATAAARDWTVRAAADSPDLDEAFAILVARSPAHAMAAVHEMDAGRLTGAAAERTVKRALNSDSAVRELFERFRPESDRVLTLGLAATADKILAKPGDPTRGAAILSPTGKAATCLACHYVKGTGRDFGPDLSLLGARATTATIIESLLQPSKVIAPGFTNMMVTLQDGAVHGGFLVKRSEQSLSLKLATGQTVDLPVSRVKAEQKLPVSLMPEGLLQSFTAQEAADLVAYLASLK
jgi:putative heme-binding domain-containing protein